MGRLPWWIAAGFLPASLGLLFQLVLFLTAPPRLFATALVLLSLEQARMAVIDLQQIATVRQNYEDPRLTRFQGVVLITIGLELLGFYLSLGWLGWGALVVLGSQLFFNGVAQIELDPTQSEPILACGWSHRKAVLGANILGLGLVGMWLLGIGHGAIAASLLAIVIAYLGLKYWPDDKTHKP
jgi:hypothetical protein